MVLTGKQKDEIFIQIMPALIDGNMHIPAFVSERLESIRKGNKKQGESGMMEPVGT
jgi:hypothetical protein